MTVNNEANTTALDDAQLQKAVGGIYDGSPAKTTDVFDKQGRKVGFYSRGVLYYWQCTHCGKPVHLSNALYWCDPCDDWWLNRADHIWHGTEDELIATAG